MKLIFPRLGVDLSVCSLMLCVINEIVDVFLPNQVVAAFSPTENLEQLQGFPKLHLLPVTIRDPVKYYFLANRRIFQVFMSK